MRAIHENYVQFISKLLVSALYAKCYDSVRNFIIHEAKFIEKINFKI